MVENCETIEHTEQHEDDAGRVRRRVRLRVSVMLAVAPRLRAR